MTDKTNELLETGSDGLSLLEVEKRRQAGLGNEESQAPTKSKAKVISEHVFTPFNLLNFVLFLIVIFVAIDRPKYIINGLFFGVAIVNTVSGTIQELKARKEVLRLSLLNQPRTLVLREAKIKEIPTTELVVGDLIELRTENQIAVDAKLIKGMNLKVDESLLTGESYAILKKDNDKLFSGSYVIAGRGLALVEKTGKETYAAKLTKEARKFRKPDSEIKLALDKVSKTLGLAILIIGLAMLTSKLLIQSMDNWHEVLVSTVAALVGMIPEGLVLLNSVAFVVGVIRLSKNNILVQRMSTIESLARVDVLCLDKTGTITSGKMRVVNIQPINNYNITEEKEKLMAQALIALNDQNSTAKAIIDFLDVEPMQTDDYEIDCFYSFSSDKKWSGVHFKKHGTWIFGASELLLNKEEKSFYGDLVYEKAKQGQRIIAVARTENRLLDYECLPNNLESMCLIEIEDELRVNAKETFDYFAEQNVEIKIISGDNPITVRTIAHKAGIRQFDNVIDMSSLGEDINYSEIISKYQLFGRVTPFQKKELLLALRAKGHVVAMVGDGVNDVPALKAADCSIAMSQGSDAARVSADLVLMNNDLFEMIPTVNEGRRIINNIEKVAVLFLTKTVYMSILAFLFIFLPGRFPLFPIQITLIGSGTIGIPGFFLSLMPNNNRVSGNFLNKTLRIVLPIGIAAAVSIVLHQWGMILFAFPQSYNGTISLIVLLTISMFALWRACQPLNKYTFGIAILSLMIIVVAFLIFPNIFFLEKLSLTAIIYTGSFMVLSLLLIKVLDSLMQKHLRKMFY